MFLAAMMLTNPPIDIGAFGRFVGVVNGFIWQRPISQTSTGMKTSAFLEKRFSTLFHRLNTKYVVKIQCFGKPSTKVAILLYYLGSIAEYRTIANLFGVSKSFVSLCIKEVAIVRKLKTSFLFVPKGEDLKEVMKINREK